MSMAFARPIVLDLSEVFGLGATSPKRASPLAAKLAAWAPNRPASIHDLDIKLAEADSRRAEVRTAKVAKLGGNSSPTTKAAELAAARQANAVALAAEIAKKVEGALNRAAAEKKRKVAVAHKMSNVKVGDLRREERASLAFTRELNHQRHADAEARAAAARAHKVAKGTTLAAEYKYAAVKEAEAAHLARQQQAQQQRMAAALARADAAKGERARAAAAMSGSPSTKAAAVKAMAAARADEKRSKLALRQAAVAARAHEHTQAKVHKAIRMSSTPTKDRSAAFSAAAASLAADAAAAVGGIVAIKDNDLEVGSNAGLGSSSLASSEGGSTAFCSPAGTLNDATVDVSPTGADMDVFNPCFQLECGGDKRNNEGHQGNDEQSNGDKSTNDSNNSGGALSKCKPGDLDSLRVAAPGLEAALPFLDETPMLEAGASTLPLFMMPESGVQSANARDEANGTGGESKAQCVASDATEGTGSGVQAAITIMKETQEP